MKPASLLIVSPSFPPRRGGVADHTQRLLEELSGHLDLTVLTSREAEEHPSVPVRSSVADWQDATALVAEIEAASPDKIVLWQYVPHMYGRGGVNPGLRHVFTELRTRGFRQLVVAHEIAAPFSLWPHRFLYGLAQRRQWRTILECADFIGISTEAWLNPWLERAPGSANKLALLPSPSTIPRKAANAETILRWRHRLGLRESERLLTFFGDVSAAKQFDWVVEAWRASWPDVDPVALIVVGGRPNVRLPDVRRNSFKPLGYLAAGEASLALQATDLLALPFVDGVSERRTSFMAGLSHGCAVLTTAGHGTGPTLRAADFFDAAPANDRSEFVRRAGALLADRERCGRLRKLGRAAYEKAYDWPVVTERLLRQVRSSD